MTKDEIQKVRDALFHSTHNDDCDVIPYFEALRILDAALAAPADDSVVWHSIGELEQAIKDAARFRWLEKQAYQGISRLNQVLWGVRGLFGKDNQTFGEAIDATMKESSNEQ